MADVIWGRKIKSGKKKEKQIKGKLRLKEKNKCKRSKYIVKKTTGRINIGLSQEET
jgi:hypothetical protein